MEKSYKVGSDTVEAYGAKNLPASFVILLQFPDGETEVEFSIQEIGGQRLYVSNDFVSLSNATFVRSNLSINSNLITQQISAGWEAKFVLSDHAINNINDPLPPQPHEYCAAVLAFLREVK
jgi:hypothetical protein